MRALKYLLLVSVMLNGAALASEAVPWGQIEALTYRGGYVLFKVVGSAGNACATCPVDPAVYSTGNCWIDETKTAQVSMLLMAKAQKQMIKSRVPGLSTDCAIYQMTIED